MIFDICYLIFVPLLVGPNIQYHIGSGVLKTNATENTNIGGQTSTVQYTTCEYSILDSPAFELASGFFLDDHLESFDRWFLTSSEEFHDR